MRTKSLAKKPKLEQSRNTIIKTISLPKDILATAVERAAATRRTLSNHVTVCIEMEAAAAK